MSDFNVLISSAGRRVALLNIFRRTLQELGLRGKVMSCDASRVSAAFQVADQSFQVPRCTHPDFFEAVFEICRTQRIRVLVPTIDTELSLYARNRERFAEIGTTVLISAPEVIAIANDKRNTYAWLKKEGLPTIQQAAAEEVLSDPRGWVFPLIAKPSGGSCSIGVKVVQDLEQLRATLDGTDCIVQTLAPGNEYTVDFLADKSGTCICAIPRLRLETRAGEVSKGLAVRCRPVIELTEELCARLPGPYGALNVQMFWEQETGELNVIEMNPRFGGGYPLSWEAGGKYPQWIIEEILNIPSTAARDRWQNRLLMLRYDDAVFVDAAEAGL